MLSEFNPLVTIVIPVFNGSNYLKEAIDSALSQTYMNLEVIVVNDGSQDGGLTEDIALGYGDQIRYFAKQNGGTSTALNLGISNMRGEYFCWLSHDDLYHSECVEAQIKSLSNLDDKATITMTDLCTMDENYRIMCEDTDYSFHIREWPQRVEARLYPVIYMKLHGCQIMFHRSVFERVGLFDEEMLVAQDFEFFARAFREFPHVLIPRVLGTARDSSNRQGRRSASKGSDEYSRVFLGIIDSFMDEDFAKLAESKLHFLKDMQYLYKHNFYEAAYIEITRRLRPYIHLNYTDLAGRGFNGYDLHLDMQKSGYNSLQFVWEKKSKTQSVIELKKLGSNASLYNDVERIESEFSVRSMISPFLYDFFHSPSFQDAELIHLHIIHHPAFNLNMLPLLSEMKPTVWTVHDPWAVSGHCVHHGACDKWMSHCGDCPNLETPFSVQYDNTAIQFELKKRAITQSNVHCVVASHWMEKILRKSPIFNGKMITRVPFGIDQQVFRPGNRIEARKRAGLPEAGVVLLARADRAFKGTPLVVKTAEQAAKHFSVTLVLVGETGLAHELRGIVNVVEKGWLNNPVQVADLYLAADLVLMPSELESFGLMAAEAMSCGRVVVALAIESSALPETVDSPNCGLAVPLSEYSSAVLDLLNSSHEILEREKKSLEFARSEYSKATYISRMLHVYKQVVADFPLSDNSKFLIEQLRKASPGYWKAREVISMVPAVPAESGASLPVGRPVQAFSLINKISSFYAQHGFMTTARKVGAVISRRLSRR
jgi:glycosyltransferase involved in cell wall biosynthesis